MNANEKFSLGYWDDRFKSESGEREIYLLDFEGRKLIENHYDLPEPKQIIIFIYNPEAHYCRPATADEQREFLGTLLPKATPGPWKVQFDSYGSPKVISTGPISPATICLDFYDENYEPDIEEIMANAQLCAMAREVYEILEKVDWPKLFKQYYAAQAAWPGLGNTLFDLINLARKYNIAPKQ